MEENFNIFDFALTADEMAAVEALDGGWRLFFSHYAPLYWTDILKALFY